MKINKLCEIYNDGLRIGARKNLPYAAVMSHFKDPNKTLCMCWREKVDADATIDRMRAHGYTGSVVKTDVKKGVVAIYVRPVTGFATSR